MPILDLFRKRSARPRLGVPIIAQQQLRTNLVVVFVDLDAEEALRSVHQSVSGLNPEALTIDDSDAANPVYFFDLAFRKIKIPVGDSHYALVFSVFGIKGWTHPSLDVLCQRGHEFLAVASAEDGKASVDAFRARLPKEKQAQVHVCVPGRYLDALKSVTQDVWSKSQA